MSAKAMKTTAATEETRRDVATAGDNAMFSGRGGAGFDEGVDKNAYALPFLGILQALSPTVQRGTPQFLPEAAPGLLFNTVTKEMFTTVDVTVLRRTHTYCFWVPREKGGGFKGEEPGEGNQAMEQLFTTGCKIDEKKRRITPDGLEMTEHRNFYCLQFLPGAGPQPVVVSMTKSQLKAARAWNSLIRLKSAVDPGNGQPVADSMIWTLGTELRAKDGNQWYGWTAALKAQHTERKIYDLVLSAAEMAKQQGPLARAMDPNATEEEPSGEM